MRELVSCLPHQARSLDLLTIPLELLRAGFAQAAAVFRGRVSKLDNANWNGAGRKKGGFEDF